MPGRSFKWMLYTLIPKEHDTDAYYLTYDIINNTEIHYNYIDSWDSTKTSKQKCILINNNFSNRG